MPCCVCCCCCNTEATLTFLLRTNRYHLGVGKTTSDYKTHCPHASKSGGGQCTSTAGKRYTAFCENYVDTCKDAKGQYPFKAYMDCAASVAAMPLGTQNTDKAGHSFSCRE